MNKYAASILIILSCSAIQLAAHPQEAHARSFMYTRPGCYNMAMYQAGWYNFMYDKTEHGSRFQIIGFHQRSQERDTTKRYFLPSQVSEEIVVAGDAIAADFFTRDVRAEWIGLPDTFRGMLTINPEQKQNGAILQFNQDIEKISGDILTQNTWISFSMPLVSVENAFNPAQSMIMTGSNPPTQAPHDILEAFNQPDWKYGKFCPQSHKVFGASELRIDLGRNYIHKNKHHKFSYFSFLSIPFADWQDPSFIFAPYAGNNHHIGFGFGTYMHFLLNQNIERYMLNYFINLEGIWLFRNKQRRTFDLRDKQWSRFLPMNRKDGPPNQNIPGVNVLTLEVIVEPYGMFDFSTGWRLQAGPCEFEIGYNAWGHDKEKIKLRDTPAESFCFEEYGIAGCGTIVVKGHEVGASSSNSTINCKAPDDETFVTIRIQDIDFESGASASALVHKVHLAFSLMRKDAPVEVLFNIGGFFEVPQKNSALRNHGMWVKYGMAF